MLKLKKYISGAKRLIDTNLCKTDDGEARPKHVAAVTSCRIQLSVVLCKDGLIQ